MREREFMVKYVAQENINQALVQQGNAVVHSCLTQFAVKVPSNAVSIKTALSGKEQYRVNGVPFTLSPSEFLLVRKGDEVECEINSPVPVEGMCYYLDDILLEEISAFYKMEENELLARPESEKQTPALIANAFPFDQSLLARYLSTFSNSLKPGNVLNTEWFYQLGLLLLQHQGAIQKEINRLPASKRSTREELYKRLLTGKAYLEANIGSTVTMEEVAREACLSTYHFIRRFSQAFGISPYQYLLKRRLEQAAKMLSATDLPIRNIAHQIGMGDIHLFSRQFKKYYQICPSQYRMQACA